MVFKAALFAAVTTADVPDILRANDQFAHGPVSQRLSVFFTFTSSYSLLRVSSPFYMTITRSLKPRQREPNSRTIGALTISAPLGFGLTVSAIPNFHQGQANLVQLGCNLNEKFKHGSSFLQRETGKPQLHQQ